MSKEEGKRHKGFQRKLQEYRTVTGDDGLLTQNINTAKKEVLRFSTSQEMIKELFAASLSIQVPDVTTGYMGIAWG